MKYLNYPDLLLHKEEFLYHLRLRKDQIPPIIITVGDPARVEEVAKHFDEITDSVNHREFNSSIGRIGNKRLMVISSGIGTDNIEILLNELDAIINPPNAADFNQLTFIRLGTTGSIHADIPENSLLQTRNSVGLDQLPLFYAIPGTEQEEFLEEIFSTHLIRSGVAGFSPRIIAADTKLSGIFAKHFLLANTLTCSGFFAPQGRTLRFSPRIPDWIKVMSSVKDARLRISNMEMETSAIYQLSRMMGHQAISLNAVVVNRISKRVSGRPDILVEKMINRALEQIVNAEF